MFRAMLKGRDTTEVRSALRRLRDVEMPQYKEAYKSSRRRYVSVTLQNDDKMKRLEAANNR